jgi:UPF0716 protein FxsA
MRVRRGWPLVLLLVLLVAVPTAEIWLIVQVAERIGVWATVAVLVVEALLGGWLIRREGRRTWRALVTTFETGRVPAGELADAALVLVGGILLLLPGFLGDVIGFLFLLPMTRPLARRLVAFFIAREIGRLAVPVVHRGGPAGDVIRGETVEGPVGDPEAGPGADPVVIRGEVTDR